MSKSQPKFFYGWRIVALSFIVITVCYGVYYSFGVFLRPLLTEFGWTTAETSGIFSLCIFVHGISGVIMGWCTDKFGPRVTVVMAGIFTGFGLLLTNFVNAIWQLYLFYGVLVGIGVGASYTPLASTISRWFVKKRGLALGIISAGIGMGTLIMAPLAEYLILNYGWHTAYTVMGIAVLSILVPSSLFFRGQPRELNISPYGGAEILETEAGNKQVGQLSLRAAASTKPFWVIFLIYASMAFATFIVLVHIAAYAVDKGISAMAAANLLGAIGGAGIIGRIVVGASSDRFGARRSMALMLIIQALATVSLTRTSNTVALFLSTVLFGFAYGGCVPLFPVIIAEYFGIGSMGAIFGSLVLGGTTGGAIGSLVAGYIFDLTGTYHLAFLLSASFAILGLILLIVLRLLKRPRARTMSF